MIETQKWEKFQRARDLLDGKLGAILLISMLTLSGGCNTLGVGVDIGYSESDVEERFGDLSEEEIKDFLKGCRKEDLLYMSEFFENIYEKFNNDDMWQFLEEMEQRIG